MIDSWTIQCKKISKHTICIDQLNKNNWMSFFVIIFTDIYTENTQSPKHTERQIFTRHKYRHTDVQKYRHEDRRTCRIIRYSDRKL